MINIYFVMYNTGIIVNNIRHKAARVGNEKAVQDGFRE